MATNMKEENAIRRYLETMRGVTQSLVRLDENGSPAFLSPPAGGGLLASGFFVRYGERLLLVSAKHALEKGTWALETEVVHRPSREVLSVRLGQPVHLPNADLSFVEIDEERLRQQFRLDARNAGKELKLITYNGSLTEMVSSDEAYGFAAANNVTLVTTSLANPDLHREGSYEIGMSYEGIEADGRYRFKLARAHQGDGYYRGSSGAPISATDGTIVSVVSSGRQADNVIYGAPLAALAAELSNR